LLVEDAAVMIPQGPVCSRERERNEMGFVECFDLIETHGNGILQLFRGVMSLYISI
jgi:hypothetical protein